MLMMHRKSSRERGPMIRTLLEEAEEPGDEEEKEVERQQFGTEFMETNGVPSTQTTDHNITVRALVEPVLKSRPRQHLVRRSSSAVERIAMPLAQEEKQDGGDKSLRPRFLQERSATIVHITPAAMSPSRAPRSKASAFLLGVLAKSKGSSTAENRNASLEPLRPGVTNTLHYVPPQGVERGVPLRMAGRNSRRFGCQLSIGPASALVDRGIPDGAIKRRVSASQEHMVEIVRALQASRQQMPQQLEILHSLLRFINASERDDGGKRPVIEEMVDVGLIPELASIMREFRFHTGLQLCVMDILSVLAEESHIYAYMMSEHNLEKLIQKTVAVHMNQDRLILLATNLIHAIEDSKQPINIQAYQAAKAAKVRRQSATYTDMLMAAITAKPKPAQAKSATKDHRTCQSATEVTRSRDLIHSASSSEKIGSEILCSSLSGQRQDQVFALDVAPPALSAHYRLIFAQKLKKSELLPLQEAKCGSTGPLPAEGNREKKHDCLAASPSQKSLRLELKSRSHTAAIYSSGSIFVEPSPLLKRLPYRGSVSAGGVRRTLSTPKKIQRVQTERRPRTSGSTIQPSTSGRNLLDLEAESNPVAGTTEENTASFVEGSVKKEDDDTEEESYEDDFDTTGDENGDEDKKMPSRSQIASDSELMDIILQGRSDQESISSTSLSSSSRAEVDAATTIQRHIRGVLVRRECARSSRNSSSTNGMPTPGKKTPLMSKNGKRGLKSEGSRGKRVPFSARAHRQLQTPGKSRGNLRSEGCDRSMMRMRPLTAKSLTSHTQARSKIKTKGKSSHDIDIHQCSQETNNQLASPSRTSQLRSLSLAKEVFETNTSKPDPEHTLDDVEARRIRPVPEALTQIQLLYAEGLQHHKEKHLGLAIECYEKALFIPGGQSFASLHVNLGSALMAQNKFSEALESFEYATRIQPNNVKAMYNYSLALLHLDRPREAQRLLRRVLELDVTHEKATIALCHLQDSVGSPTIHLPHHGATS